MSLESIPFPISFFTALVQDLVFCLCYVHGFLAGLLVSPLSQPSVPHFLQHEAIYINKPLAYSPWTPALPAVLRLESLSISLPLRALPNLPTS